MFRHIKYITRGKKGDEGKDLLSTRTNLPSLRSFRTAVLGFAVFPFLQQCETEKKITTRVTSVRQNIAAQVSGEGSGLGVPHYLHSHLHATSARPWATPSIGGCWHPVPLAEHEISFLHSCSPFCSQVLHELDGPHTPALPGPLRIPAASPRIAPGCDSLTWAAQRRQQHQPARF